MFKTHSPFLNLVLNFVIAIILFSVLRSWGWITITSDLQLWLIVLIAGFVNILTRFLVELIAGLTSTIWIAIAACTSWWLLLVVAALISYFTLMLTGLWTGLFSVTTIWWQAIVLGLMFSLFRFSVPSND